MESFDEIFNRYIFLKITVPFKLKDMSTVTSTVEVKVLQGKKGLNLLACGE